MRPAAPATATRRLMPRRPPRPGRRARRPRRTRPATGPMPAAESRSGAHSSSTSSRRSSSVTASTLAMISSASSSGRPYSVEPPRRFMRAAEDSSASTTRALTFSRARASSSSVAGSLAQAVELAVDDRHRLGEVVRPRADVEADLARVGELAGERVDGVGQPALLAHALEQPRGRQPAEDRVEHAQREAALVVARQAGPPRQTWTCSVSLRLEAHARRGQPAAPRRARARPRRRAGRRACARPARRSASWSTEPAAATTTEPGT